MTDPSATDLVRRLEECAFNALPAHQTVLQQGWVLRLSGGFTKRANSVNALEPGAPFAGMVDAATQLYARHGLPAVFRLSPLAPAEADHELSRAGYVHFDPCLVLHAPLPATTPPDASTTLATTPSDAWIDALATATGVPPHHRALKRAMLQSIAQPAAFATLHAQGVAVGFGLAVLERGMVGLYDIVIAPGHRGSGRGRALVNALLHWGAGAGATSAYLQVLTQNTPALRLYEGLGFRPVYDYHYRVPC